MTRSSLACCVMNCFVARAPRNDGEARDKARRQRSRKCECMPIPVPETPLILIASCSTEGRFANVTDAGQDAVDAAASGWRRVTGRNLRGP